MEKRTVRTPAQELDRLMKNYHNAVAREDGNGILGQVSVDWYWEDWMNYYNSLTKEERPECVRPPGEPFACTDACGLSNVQRVNDLKTQYDRAIDEWEGTGLGQGYVDRAWRTWRSTYNRLTDEKKIECISPTAPLVLSDWGRKHNPYGF